MSIPADLREPYGNRHRVTPEIEQKAIAFLERRGWALRTVADLYRVHEASLRRALCTRYGRARVYRAEHLGGFA